LYPKDRYHDIADARVDVQKALADPRGVLVQPITAVELRSRMRTILPWAAAALVLGLIIAGVSVWNLRKPEPKQVMRFDYELPGGLQFNRDPDGIVQYEFAVSSDGSQFVYSTTEGLYLCSMNTQDAIL
jgi:hypothetical protein